MTAFTELVGCRLPIQLAGMGGGGSDVGLTSAVSNAGGFGTLGAGGLPAPVVEQMLDAMPGATDKPFGINFLMPLLDRDAVTAAVGRCRLVEFFYGDPDAVLVDIVHSGGGLAGWQVGSGAEARAAVDAGCDFVIAQGTEAGGHVRGTKPLATVLRDVRGVVGVPIVAAGGIGTAKQVKAALNAGASAVRIGTRFLAATESVYHPDYVAALIAATADDTELTETFGNGWPDAPHRVLKASIAAAQAANDDVVGTMSMGPMQVPVARFSPMAPTKNTIGNIAAMAMYAGTSVDAVTKRQSVAEIIAELCSEIS
jgi:nitronate monooxygenase